MKTKLCLVLFVLTLIALCLVSCQTSSGTPSFTIDENGYLIANYPNGNSQVVGMVKPADGKDGKSVSTATINEKGELILTFSDGVQSNLGNIIGKDGENGKDGHDGTNGKDGKDGVGIEAIDLSEGQLSIKYTDGQIVPLGRVVGTDGRGIRSIRLIDNVWYIQYTDGMTDTVVPETTAEGGIISGSKNTEEGWGSLIPVE